MRGLKSRIVKIERFLEEGKGDKDRMPLEVLHLMAEAHEKELRGEPPGEEEIKALAEFDRHPAWQQTLDRLAAIADECGEGGDCSHL